MKTMHANTFSDEIEKKHQEGTCSFPICCSEAIEVTSPTNLKDANPKMLGTLQDDLKNSKKIFKLNFTHAPVGKSSNEGVGCDRTMCRCNFSKSVGLLAVLTRSHTSWRVLGDGRNPNSNIFNHRSTTGWLNNGWNQDLPRVPNGSHRSNFQKTRLFFLPKDKKCVIYDPPARSPAPHCNMFFLT